MVQVLLVSDEKPNATNVTKWFKLINDRKRWFKLDFELKLKNFIHSSSLHIFLYD